MNRISRFIATLILMLLCLCHDVNATQYHPRFDTIRDRIDSRNYPSIFDTWCDMGGCAHVDGASDVFDRRAKFDLSYEYEWFNWDDSVKRPILSRPKHRIRPHQNRVSWLNPNKLYLAEVRFANTSINWNYFPDDSDFWIRDENDNRVPIATGSPWYLIDFTNPGVQQIIIQQVVDIADTGKYDGVFFDYWQDERDVLNGYRTIPQQQQARLAILRGIRDRVHPDFLILGNVNANTMPLSAPFINGAMMETYQSMPVDGQRTELFLLRLESTLSWSEHNLRTPRINCLWLGLRGKDYTNPQVQQWLRLITTMSLTMSDGYVSFNNGQYSGHRYEWHAFWNVELGQPVSGKELIFNGTSGFYTRDFTKGFVAYNRSNKAQLISFDERVTSIATDETAAFHTIPAMDGDIFLYGSENTIAVDPGGLLTTLWGKLKRK